MALGKGVTMIYTIIGMDGFPITDERDGRPFAFSDRDRATETSKRLNIDPRSKVFGYTNVELIELWIKVIELRNYLNSEKFSKDESVDRKDVLRRLGF
jgi:hypothetical protein